jgi:GT2 family glycosyltransferase
MVGGFDASREPLAAEDAEIGFRIRRAGYQLRFERHARVGHFHPTDLVRYLETQKHHGYWRIRLDVRHPARLGGDIYHGLIDYAQPALAVLLLATIPFLFAASARWFAIGILLALAAAQAPMTWRVVRRTQRPRYVSFATMSFVRAFWRGAGMTSGLISAVWARTAEPV